MNTTLYDISALLLRVADLKFLMVVPIGLIIVTVIYQTRVIRLELLHVLVALSALPMLVPFLAELGGFKYITWMNHGLQHDQALKLAAFLLIFIFTYSVLVGARLPHPRFFLVETEPVSIGAAPIIGLFIVNFFLMYEFLESGTVLFSSYGQIKSDVSPFSSTVNQFFNVSVALAFASIPNAKRLRLIQFIIIVFLIFTMLTSRRTLFVGLLLLLVYTFDVKKLKIWHIFILGLGMYLIMFIGEARDVGILNYLAGYRHLYYWRDIYNMAGGGANIFVGVMGVIDLMGSGKLSFPENMPILLWAFGENESTIYERSGYQYLGGMHIVSVIYWNFGLLGVVVGGLALGRLCKSAGDALHGFTTGSRGTLGVMLSIAFVLVLPNTIWYSPIGLVKLSCAVVVGYLLLASLNRQGRQGALA